MRSLVAAVSACLLISGANAQERDPYAADVAKAARARLQADYDEFLDGVRLYSYAIGCDVLPAKAQAWGAISQAQFRFINKLEPFETMSAKIRQILRDGPAIAQSKGCAVFKDNPDLVLEMRAAALAQRMP